METVNTTNKQLETKRIILYLVLTFGITCAYCFLGLYPIVNNEALSVTLAPVVQLLVAVIMFFPALGVLLTRLITKEGFQGAWIRPNFKGNIKTYLLAYFGPWFLVILGAAVYFLIFPDKFDAGCGYMVASLEAAGAGADAIPMPMSLYVIIQAVTSLFIGPIVNIFTCFGEEWGWRGYLLPKMAKKLPAIPMLLVNGIIWGLWHAPLTAIGHNYGTGYPGFPFTGIAAMCGFCIVAGVFLSYVAMKTKSCIPAAIGHGAINSIAAIGMLFTTDGGNPFVGPAPTGIVGAIPFIIVAVLMCVFYFRKQNFMSEETE